MSAGKTEQCLEALALSKQLIDEQQESLEKLDAENKKLLLYKDKHAKAMEVIEQQNDLLLSLKNSSLGYGIIVEMDSRSFATVEALKGAGLTQIENGDPKEITQKDGEPIKTCRVMFNGNFAEVVIPERLNDLKPGDAVKIITTEEGVNIAEKSEHVRFGTTAAVKQVLDKERIVVNMNGNERIVLTLGRELEVDDKVMLDEHAIMVLAEEKQEKRFIHTENTGVDWDDIGGQKQAKEDIREAIEGPIKNAEMYKAYGQKPPKGLLLWGPPGNGKTMFGKAIATSVKSLYGSDADGFIYVKGPEILNMYVGNSEAAIRNLFEMARKFKEKHNAPAVLFIDEAEAILSKRGSGKSSDVDKTIVPQFLAEMDGLNDSACIVVLVTNRPDMLDSAIIREGRIDKKIRIPKPDMDAAKSIFSMNLKKTKFSGNCDDLVRYATNRVFDSGLVIYELELKSGATRQFTYADIINGAMLTAIVTDAVGLAIKEDLAKKSSTPTGVNEEILEKAIIRSFEQNVSMNHEEHLKDLQYELALTNDEIKNYKPIKATTDVRAEESIS